MFVHACVTPRLIFLNLRNLLISVLLKLELEQEHVSEKIVNIL